MGAEESTNHARKGKGVTLAASGVEPSRSRAPQAPATAAKALSETAVSKAMAVSETPSEPEHPINSGAHEHSSAGFASQQTITPDTDSQCSSIHYIDKAYNVYKIYQYIPANVLQSWLKERLQPSLSPHVESSRPETVIAFDAAVHAYNAEMEAEAQALVDFNGQSSAVYKSTSVGALMENFAGKAGPSNVGKLSTTIQPLKSKRTADAEQPTKTSLNIDELANSTNSVKASQGKINHVSSKLLDDAMESVLGILQEMKPQNAPPTKEQEKPEKSSTILGASGVLKTIEWQNRQLRYMIAQTRRINYGIGPEVSDEEVIKMAVAERKACARIEEEDAIRTEIVSLSHATQAESPIARDFLQRRINELLERLAILDRLNTDGLLPNASEVAGIDEKKLMDRAAETFRNMAASTLDSHDFFHLAAAISGVHFSCSACTICNARSANRGPAVLSRGAYIDLNGLYGRTDFAAGFAALMAGQLVPAPDGPQKPLNRTQRRALARHQAREEKQKNKGRVAD